MKKIIFILLIAAIGCKEKPKYGGVAISDDPAELAKVPFYTVEAMTESVLPPSVRLTMPPTFNQGGEGSCASMAVVNVRSAEEYYRKGATSYSNAVNIFSPEYLYNQAVVGGCGGGSSLMTNLDILKEQGVCTNEIMPYSSTNGCSVQPDAAQRANAANYKISSYSQIFLTDSIAIKTALANNHPLVIQVSMDDNLYNAGPGFVWNTWGTFVQNHGLALVGYDDSRNAWLLLNSFGTGWGDGGYVWADYQFLKTVAYVVFKLNFDTPVPCPASGTLIRTQCNGVDKYGVYANGSCGEYTALLQANSPECGYVTPDTEKPVTTITTPLDGYQISKSLKSLAIISSATDNVGVVSMRITITNAVSKAVQITKNCTGNSCSYTWNIRGLASGSYLINVAAMDKAGNVGEKTITVKK